MAHWVTYLHIEHDEVPYLARCSCGARSGQHAVQQLAQDWWLAHQADVNRLRASLGTRDPSMVSQRNYYARQAENPHNTEEDRRLWRQLADELTHRINDYGDSPADTPLF